MRHKKDHRKLNRTPSHRQALLKNLARALILEKRIETTVPKAKELKRFTEKLISSAKKGPNSSYDTVMKKIPQKDVCKILYEEIVPKYMERNGGYVRIIRTTRRKGDNAEMAIIEFV